MVSVLKNYQSCIYLVFVLQEHIQNSCSKWWFHWLGPCIHRPEVFWKPRQTQENVIKRG